MSKNHYHTWQNYKSKYFPQTPFITKLKLIFFCRNLVRQYKRCTGRGEGRAQSLPGSVKSWNQGKFQAPGVLSPPPPLHKFLSRKCTLSIGLMKYSPGERARKLKVPLLPVCWFVLQHQIFNSRSIILQLERLQ